MGDDLSHLKKQEILNWFGGKDNYEHCHLGKQQELNNENLFFEDGA